MVSTRIVVITIITIFQDQMLEQRSEFIENSCHVLELSSPALCFTLHPKI